jgi:hypothetical protein
MAIARCLVITSLLLLITIPGPAPIAAAPADAPSGQLTWVEEPGIGLIAGYAFSAPFEEVKLKAR